MIQQTTGQLMLRLERIWSPVDPLDCRSLIPNHLWLFDGRLRPDARLHFVHSDEGKNDSCILLRVDESSESPVLLCRGHSVTTRLEENFPLDFALEWILPFRRGCWLSGCSIEATTYEKAQWMQDFSYQELEEWNLEF